MAFIIPALGAIGAGASATGLATAATVASVGGSVISGVSQFAQSRYQARVLSNNAAIEEANAERAIFEGNVSAQDRDLQASGELGALIARQAGSGLDTGSGSFVATLRGQEELASLDRARIVTQGEVRAAEARSRAADNRAGASQARRAGNLGVLASAADVTSSLISGASLVRRAQRTGSFEVSSRPLGLVY